MILVSSNENKLKEFREIIPDIIIEKGKDLPEVKGNKEEVILYKAIEAGKDRIVEDTILEVNHKEIVDIKWKKDKLKEGDQAIWFVHLGYNDGENIKIYKGEIKGIISLKKIINENNIFGFDSIFIPENSNHKTLYELKLENKKNDFSARKLAILNLINSNSILEVKIKDVKLWQGNYQNEEINSSSNNFQTINR